MMLGAIIGDIAGSWYELKTNRTKNYDFELFPKGSRFTDDTIFTLAVANAYIEYKSLKIDDLDRYRKILISSMVKLGKKYNYFSESTTHWLDNPVPYGSFGTGAAMRVSALAHLIDDLDELKRIVKITTDVSHNNAEAEDSAEVCALCVYYLIHGKDKDFVRNFVKNNYYKYLDNYTYDIFHRHYVFNMPTSIHVQTAINCFLESENFEDCLRKTISLGGDSDTQAAISCSMAAVYYGIPSELSVKALSFLPDDLKDILNKIEIGLSNRATDIFITDILNRNKKIAVVGLGYVGLPLAVEFSKVASVVGIDINEEKIDKLSNGIDDTNETDVGALENGDLFFTTDFNKLDQADFVIVAIPTPVDEKNKPDLSLLINACAMIGPHIHKGMLISFESTVYPGTTTGLCRTVLSDYTDLNEGIDFFVGYSPERINPADRNHRLKNIVKIVSASNPLALSRMEKLYGLIVDAGIFATKDVKTAEAAKIIENCQRDVNIALMNELSIIFEKMGLNTKDVIEAASTKWNFAKYMPGIVGGHCIGVDPYYLIYASENEGISPRLLKTARQVNEDVLIRIENKVKDISSNLDLPKKRIGILGLTFKENCPDIRNSKAIELTTKLYNDGFEIVAFDPYVENCNYEFNVVNSLDKVSNVDILLVLVQHNLFSKIDKTYINNVFRTKKKNIIDIKHTLNLETDEDLILWRL